jgi:hypothetical protein
LREVIEESAGFRQIGEIETLGKPFADRCEKVASFGASALFEPKTGKAHGGTQLQ